MRNIVSKGVKTHLALFFVLCMVFTALNISPLRVSAKDKTESISGKLYEFEKGSKYAMS